MANNKNVFLCEFCEQAVSGAHKVVDCEHGHQGSGEAEVWGCLLCYNSLDDEEPNGDEETKDGPGRRLSQLQSTNIKCFYPWADITGVSQHLDTYQTTMSAVVSVPNLCPSLQQ